MGIHVKCEVVHLCSRVDTDTLFPTVRSFFMLHYSIHIFAAFLQYWSCRELVKALETLKHIRALNGLDGQPIAKTLITIEPSGCRFRQFVEFFAQVFHPFGLSWLESVECITITITSTCNRLELEQTPEMSPCSLPTHDRIPMTAMSKTFDCRL